MNKIFIISILFFSLACGKTSSDSESFEGKRYSVEYWRWDYVETYSLISGINEWWFFKSGIFRQIGDNYVEIYTPAPMVFTKYYDLLNYLQISIDYIERFDLKVIRCE